MRKIVKIILFSFFYINLYGTAQGPDYLIYKGDTIAIFSTPLHAYFKKVGSYEIPDFERGGSTGLWRGYIAYWELRNDSLFLKSIRSGILSEVEKKDFDTADLKKLFGDKCINNEVFADWVNEKLYSPQGELLYYIHAGFSRIYETEIEFTIEDGILIGVRNLDNSKTKSTKYIDNNGKLLFQFISNNIKRENLPESDSIKRKVILKFGSTDDNGKLDSVYIIRGATELYDKEAIRVLKSIPEWEVLYRHGKKVTIWRTCPIVFDLTKENKDTISIKK